MERSITEDKVFKWLLDRNDVSTNPKREDEEPMPTILHAVTSSSARAAAKRTYDVSPGC